MATPSNPTPSPTRIPPARSSMPAASPIPSASPVPDGSPIPKRSGQEPEPFAGYNRLSAKQVKDALSDHSQIELEAVEAYERSHKGREVVLNKLRYMRGSEPFPAYDALSLEEILAALEEADLETIDRVRGYERKFANRPRVLETVARVHRSRLAIESARAVPAYQPMSARSTRSRRGVRKRSGS
jgi:uncharacterized protein (DUF433 family)